MTNMRPFSYPMLKHHDAVLLRVNIPNISSGVFFNCQQQQSFLQKSQGVKTANFYEKCTPMNPKSHNFWEHPYDDARWKSIHGLKWPKWTTILLLQPSSPVEQMQHPKWLGISICRPYRKDNPSQESQEVYKKYKKSVDFGAPHSKGKCFGPHTNCSTPTFNWKRWSKRESHIFRAKRQETNWFVRVAR